MHNMNLLMKLRVFRFFKEEILTFHVLKYKKTLELLWNVCACVCIYVLVLIELCFYVENGYTEMLKSLKLLYLQPVKFDNDRN